MTTTDVESPHITFVQAANAALEEALAADERAARRTFDGRLADHDRTRRLHLSAHAPWSGRPQR